MDPCGGGACTGSQRGATSRRSLVCIVLAAVPLVLSFVVPNANGTPGLPAMRGVTGPMGSVEPQVTAGPILSEWTPGPSAGRLSSSVTILDQAGDVGRWSSVRIGSDGLALISYFDYTNWDLKVAHCEDLACRRASIATVDRADAVGTHSSLSIGVDGLGLISYHDFTHGYLKVAHCTGVRCSSATSSVVDSTTNAGDFGTSIAIGSDGLALVAYMDVTNAALKVAHCSDIVCHSATLSSLDRSGLSGELSHVAIGDDGLGLISYFDEATSVLKVAHCSNVLCTSASVTTLTEAGGAGGASAVAIGSDGLGIIPSFTRSGFFRIAHCSDVACMSATISTVSSFIPRLRMVSIIPGMESRAPERTESKRGRSLSPSFLPTDFSTFSNAAATCAWSCGG